jgi:hypothetical protein
MAIVIFLGAAYEIVDGVSLLFFSLTVFGVSGPAWPTSYGYLATLVGSPSNFGWYSLVFGVASLAAVVGFWGGKRWGWVLTLILFFISIVFSVLVFTPGIVVAIIFDAACVYYLTRPSVRRFFARVPPETRPA